MDMQIDRPNFTPLARLDERNKGMLKTESSADDEKEIKHHNHANSIIYNKLNDALGIEDAPDYHDQPFDAKIVAENILRFISSVINDAKQEGASNDKLEEMLSDAKEGIKTGISEATKSLQESGLYTDPIKEGIIELEDRLNNGLQTLADDLFSESSSVLIRDNEIMRYHLNKNASYRLITQEGDEVNIIFNSDTTRQSNVTFNTTEPSADELPSPLISSESAFSFQLNGELNDDEQQAINALMASLQEVSDLFFNGLVENALDRAQTVSMDITQLASFSMDLQRTETTRPIKEYQQMMPAKALSEELTPLNNALINAYQQAKPFALEAHLTDLLNWLLPKGEDTESLIDYSETVFDKLTRLTNVEPFKD